MDVLEAIQKRRSIKPQLMRPDPVDRALLMEMFAAANWAPSHGLTEPWRFIVFEGESREALVEAVISTMAENGEDTLSAEDPRRTATREKMLSAPVIVAIICAVTDRPKVVEHEEIASVAMAVQNMHLVATKHGLGGFWTSGKKAFHDKMRDFLGLVPPHRCLGFFYVGWPKIDWPDGSRGAVEDKVRWWGSR